VDSLTDPCHPKGCLLVQGALSCGADAEPIRWELAQRRMAGEAAIRRRLERAKADGDLPPGADPADLARYVATVLHGIAVQATSGAQRDDLQPVIRMALQAWPE